jgi:hypothetical protein
MNYLEILEFIHSYQARNVLTIDLIGDRVRLIGALPTGVNGLYWFWTSYNNFDLENTTRPTNLNSEINISQITKERKGLNHICSQEFQNYRLVYNGKAGGQSDTYCLRKRILQEITGQSGTGSISIRNSSLDDLTKWRISFVNFNDPEFIRGTNNQLNYLDHAEKFEVLWRLHYGWPILCRR